MKVKFQNIIEAVFYSNAFYGLCAVALSVEAALQQHTPLNSFFYFGFVFWATCVYYTHPYIRRCPSGSNPRTNWYTRHYNFIKNHHLISIVVLAGLLLGFMVRHSKIIFSIRSTEWLLFAVFPMAALLYYGFCFLNKRFTIRSIGWLKPFIIGFIWAGLVTIYPVMFSNILDKRPYVLNEVAMLLFLKNFMFVSVLCIMFDIKDYAVDYISRLKTFVVKSGLRKTIFYILLPLVITGLITFLFYAIVHNFSSLRILLNCIPFVLLIAIAWSLRRRRSLLYYLSVVDGLMLVKAVCGTIAIIYF